MTQTQAKTSPQEVAQRFRALSDEKRLRILQLLSGGERCVCELTKPLEAGQSLLSFHMKTLKEAGFVSDRRDGRWIHYSIVPEALGELADALSSLRETAEANGGAKTCCG